jgi:hypothetical protein
VAAFDALYRAKLKRLYQLLGLTIPAALDLPLSQGAGGAAEAGGVMRRGG